MTNTSNKFPHITIQILTQGTATAKKGYPKSSNSKTKNNKSDRQGHGNNLKTSLNSLITSWENNLADRELAELPALRNSQIIPIILQVDPEAFDIDELNKFGIEVIAELEDGYILGSSVNITKLQTKIEQFINDEKGGGKIPEIWEILDQIRRPEYILDSQLIKIWPQIEDTTTYTVDVGIACLGSQAELPDHPKQSDGETQEKYTQRVNNWINKRSSTYQQWDKAKSLREDEFTEFIKKYQGKILNIVDGQQSNFAELPDSFSCRVEISGKGLRDLVFNFPYIFEISLPDELINLKPSPNLPESEPPQFILQAPEINAPKVCVIDSGIQEQHPLLKEAIDRPNSNSWVPKETNQTNDYVSNGGHGTRIAGAILYPKNIPDTGAFKAICWLQNAKVLNKECQLDTQLFPPSLMSQIVNFYHQQRETKIFNLSVTASTPCRTQYMSAWAAAIDNLTWENDILFIVATGNLPLTGKIGSIRLSVQEHLKNNCNYPDYLLEDSCRIANPSQSFQCLTVGSVALTDYHIPPLSSLAKKDYPSAFSCSGLGIWDSIKPEVVEYGGDLVINEITPPDITYPPEVCPQLVRSTLKGGPLIAKDQVGTSFATPKVTHLAAQLMANLPDQSCLLYRALIVQSARWPDWTQASDVDKLAVLRQIGYGIPNLDRALGNSPHRITLITPGETKIKSKEVHIYQVQLPNDLISPSQEAKLLLEVTLSYKAQPRRTRRQRRKYLSTWLDWDCSKKGESPASFLSRMLQEFNHSENSKTQEKSFTWILGKQSKWGKIKNVSRSAGTIQKDWAIVKSFDLTEAFCIAVVGHQGWNNDPEGKVPYSLVISIEALHADIPIYANIVQAQSSILVKTEVVPQLVL